MKRLLCLALALLMMLSLAACAESGENTNETAAADDSGAVTEAGTEFFPAVEKKNYGSTFTMLNYTKPDNWYYASDRTGSVLNDAVYEMTNIIQDYLGVEMKYQSLPDGAAGPALFAEVRPHVLAGDDVYQMCIMHPFYCYTSFISEHMAYDLYEFRDNGLVDFSQDYWNLPVIDSLSVNGHAYIGLGALCKYTLYILYANKTMMQSALREMPYDDVRSGEWTLDAMYALTKDLYVDADGDGKRGNGDKYGFAGMCDVNMTSFMQASDIFVARRNEDEQFDLVLMEDDRLVNFFDPFATWFHDESVYTWPYGDRNRTEITLPFLNGQAVLTDDSLGTQYLEADFDVGILPLPKYDTAQENYQHVNWGNNIVVPSIIKEEQMVGEVLELMGYYSGTLVHNAYYDTVLQFRVSNSPDDREMVKLIYNTVVYDPGTAFCDGNNQLRSLVYTLTNCLGGTKSIASFYKSNQRSAQKWLDNLFKEK